VIPTRDSVKSCCAAAYDSELARALLGDSFHPGGLTLTQRLGELLELRPGMLILDAASGKGDSAIFLAQQFGCDVVGVDLGPVNVAEATRKAEEAGVAGRVRFVRGDVETVGLANDTFDRVICECAFCTFPDKAAAARQFARVLRREGRIGISDLTRNGPLPAELAGLLAWIACIADALPLDEYQAFLEAASFRTIQIEPHHDALLGMARDVQGRLMGLELMAGLKKIDISGADLVQATSLARVARQAILDQVLGYAIITAEI
jgi:ubiquinone/menaquinone biosynthesis C-methylase UbiE